MPSPSSAPARPALSDVGEFYRGYVELVPAGDVFELLERGLAETRALLAPLGEAGGGRRYAPGKWSVKEIVGHLADAERVFAYRALRMARGDGTPLPSFDQDAFVQGAGFDGRSLADLLEEFAHVRAASLLFFRGLAPEAWDRRGTASGAPFLVRTFPYVLCGHERHHQCVLRERYL
jgi:hypothetical protein